MPRKMDFETLYNAKDAQPFDQKYDMFKRARWVEKFRGAARRYYGMFTPTDTPGYRIEDVAARNASLWVEFEYAKGLQKGNFGIYSWDHKRGSIQALPDDAKLDAKDPEYSS